MKKVMNKKGQSEGIGLGTLFAIIIGGAAVIMILIWIFGGGTYAKKILGFAPDDLSNAVKVCGGYLKAADVSLTTLNYCKYRELTINDKKQWVNCDYIYDEAEKKVVGSAGFSKLTTGTCKENYCDTLRGKIDYDGKDYVNEKLCPLPTPN